MFMPARAHRLTVDDVRHMRVDESPRIELVDGELFVSPTPSRRHERVRMRLVVALVHYLEPLGLISSLVAGPGELTWGTDDTYVEPDLWVIDRTEADTSEWTDVRTVPLIVEVISPSSRRRDRVIKRALYQRHRVGTYWVLDPERRTASESRLGDDTLQDVDAVLEWRAFEGAPLFSFPVADLFRETAVAGPEQGA